MYRIACKTSISFLIFSWPINSDESQRQEGIGSLGFRQNKRQMGMGKIGDFRVSVDVGMILKYPLKRKKNELQLKESR